MCFYRTSRESFLYQMHSFAEMAASRLAAAYDNPTSDASHEESHHETQGDNELFAEQQKQVMRDAYERECKRLQNEMFTRPWWRANFFVHGPVLFGTWDGVFTTVMVNIFGVIAFLRIGWIVVSIGLFQNDRFFLFVAEHQ